jgi:hypothetical protein
MAARRALVCILFALAAPLCRTSSGEVDVELVVNVCRERNLHFVKTVADEILHAFTVRTTFYCKCGELVPGCVQLPNVGREAHSFLHHMVERYDSLGASRR